MGLPQTYRAANLSLGPRNLIPWPSWGLWGTAASPICNRGRGAQGSLRINNSKMWPGDGVDSPWEGEQRVTAENRPVRWCQEQCGDVLRLETRAWVGQLASSLGGD